MTKYPGLTYSWRQIKLLWATQLFGWCVALTPKDAPEFKPLAECATELYYAAKKHETYAQFKARKP